MVPEVYQVFWAGMAAGEFINDAAIAAGSYRRQGARWLAAAGGVRPRRGRGLQGRCLTLAQREEIALGRARGESIRAIAAVLGRSPSTVSRELRRKSTGGGGIGPPPRMLWPTTAPADRSRPSWSRTWNCVRRWRQTWPRSTPRSRSRAG